MPPPQTHYDNLKVARNAPPEVIRAAYRVLAQRYHPDKNPSPGAQRIMKMINEAYAVLSDPQRRADHDAWIDEQLSKNEPDAPFPGVDRQTSKPYATSPSAPNRDTRSHSPGAFSTPRQSQENASGGAWLGIWLLVGAAVLVVWQLKSRSSSSTNSSPPSTYSPSTAAPPPTPEHQSRERLLGRSASKVEMQIDQVPDRSHEAPRSNPAPMIAPSGQPAFGVSEEHRQATICYIKSHAPHLIYGTLPFDCEGKPATFVQQVRESLTETYGTVPRLDECAAILFQPAHLTVVAHFVWHYRDRSSTPFAYVFGIRMACKAALAEPVKLAR